MRLRLTPEQIQDTNNDQIFILELIEMYKNGEVTVLNLLESLEQYANIPCADLLSLEALVRAAIDPATNTAMGFTKKT